MIRHIRCVIVQVLFVLVWSVFGLTTPYNSVAEYTGKSVKDIWWRVVLECIASLAILVSIVQVSYNNRNNPAGICLKLTVKTQKRRQLSLSKFVYLNHFYLLSYIMLMNGVRYRHQ